MAKSGRKLKDALDHHKGIDRKKEHRLKQQKKQEKQAAKKRRAKEQVPEEVDNGGEEVAGVGQSGVAQEGDEGKEVDGVAVNGSAGFANGDGDEQWETDDEEDEDEEGDGATMFDLSRLDDSESSSESDFDEDTTAQPKTQIDQEATSDNDDDEDEEDDIPLSDIASLASDEKGDILPHQRLTINNTTALLAAHKRIALPLSTLPFSAHMSLTTLTPVSIPDINDDIARELEFIRQAQSAALEARRLCKKEGIPFTRPTDYFAEMVKSDEHMGRVRQKLVDEAAGKKAAAEARRQRDLKKFGKQVQVAKLQEREKQKRETLEKINVLKRKRQGANLVAADENDLFDVALEDATTSDKADRAARRGGAAGGKPNFKRQKKDQKYGFGGKKRFAKSGDAASSADMRAFSTKKMKGTKQRPGKSRRQKRV